MAGMDLVLEDEALKRRHAVYRVALVKVSVYIATLLKSKLIVGRSRAIIVL